LFRDSSTLLSGTDDSGCDDVELFSDISEAGEETSFSGLLEFGTETSETVFQPLKV